MKPFLFAIFVALFLLVGAGQFAEAVSVDINLSLDKSNWMDPNDPLSDARHHHTYYQHSAFDGAASTTPSPGACDGHCEHLLQEVNELRRLYSAQQHMRENTVDVLLKHVLRGMLTALDVDVNATVAAGVDVYRGADVHFTLENIWAIHRYLASQRHSEEVGLREDLRSALDGFITVIKPTHRDSLFGLVAWLAPYVALLNAVVLPLAAWNALRHVCSVRQAVLLVFFSAFCVSCYFTYSRKYQEILAQRFEREHKRFRDGCTPSGLLSEAYGALLSYVRIKGKNECLQHYEDLLIEPFWLIDPLSVVAEVLSNFVLTPISVAGIHLNKFFSDFFINTPLYLAIIKVLFLFCVLFYLTGYRIRTIFATIEPGRVPISQSPLSHIPTIGRGEQPQIEARTTQTAARGNTMVLTDFQQRSLQTPQKCPDQKRLPIPTTGISGSGGRMVAKSERTTDRESGVTMRRRRGTTTGNDDDGDDDNKRTAGGATTKQHGEDVTRGVAAARTTTIEFQRARGTVRPPAQRHHDVKTQQRHGGRHVDVLFCESSFSAASDDEQAYGALTKMNDDFRRDSVKFEDAKMHSDENRSWELKRSLDSADLEKEFEDAVKLDDSILN